MMNRSLLPALSLALAATAVADDNWTQWGGPGRHAMLPADRASAEAVGLRTVWRKTVGAGKSGIIVAADAVFLHVAEPPTDPTKDNKAGYREAVVSLDRDSGEERWRFAYDAPLREGQELFGGEAPSPQATPAVVGDLVVTLGFSGELCAIERTTGKVRWQRDLVTSCRAKPVQFGFSASPLVWGDRLYVLAGGERGGLLCLVPATGAPLWNVPCGEASYATPVMAELDGEAQVIFVSRDEVVGVQADSGEVRWRHRLAEKGLTNVPTPLPLADNRLFLSGQGVKGTRLLQLERAGDTWQASEAWFNRKVQFFCCNWVERDGVLYGSEGKLFIACDIATGELLHRRRGFNDANLVGVGDHAWLLDGNGRVSRLTLDGKQVRLTWQGEVFNERCWTAPSLAGGCLYVRGGAEVARLAFVGGDGKQASRRAAEPGSAPLPTDASADPVALIVERFESQGLESAVGLYEQILMERPGAISVAAQVQLADLAMAQELNDLALRFVNDALAQEPESADALARRDQLTASNQPSAGQP